MRAGTNASIAKVPDRPITQTWSRYFYEHPSIYTEVDGLIYLGAHNDEEVLALCERAGSALESPPERTASLSDPELRTAILETAYDSGLIVEYPAADVGGPG